jgi:hypothetical protein
MQEPAHLIDHSLLPPSMFVGSDVKIFLCGSHSRRCCVRLGVVGDVGSLEFGARHCSTQTQVGQARSSDSSHPSRHVSYIKPHQTRLFVPGLLSLAVLFLRSYSTHFLCSKIPIERRGYVIERSRQKRQFRNTNVFSSLLFRDMLLSLESICQRSYGDLERLT